MSTLMEKYSIQFRVCCYYINTTLVLYISSPFSKCSDSFIVWCHSWGGIDKCVFITDRELMTDQSNDAIQTLVVEQIVFWGLQIRIWGRCYLQEQKWLKDSCNPKTHMNGGSNNLEYATQPVSNSTSYTLSFPVISFDLNLL